ncbi:MAG: FKBP-type peptidyl-prolyl cis-trans isomerase [Rubrivivax sp.]|nr:FKBP-type peptidyl-prolyl cis-trans isomerase [Rubrivivax sp.]MDP3614703.1 FKBP-type peptidyl-prolyl cis-trans isomerase [Rubrivivax sp.]
MTLLHCSLSALSLTLLALAATALPAAAQTDALKAAAAEPGARVMPSGLVIRTVKEGTGAQPAATDTVKVHYRGTFTDGREFDSSYQRGEPASFPLNRVIKCWTEGVQLIKVGGTARLTCPASIAYGERGAGGGKIPPNATLRFDVELLAINP